MMTNKQRNEFGLRIWIFLILGTLVHGVWADGYRNPAPTAEGVAKAGANLIFSDDASAISYNPANLAFQTNASAIVSANFARSENKYSPIPVITAVSDDPWVVLPNLYASMPIKEGIVFGLGITTPYGQGSKWDSTSLIPPPPVIAPVIYDAEIALININPTLAIKLSDSVSIGIGADIYYSELEFKALLPIPGSPIPLVDAKADGDDWGLGGNLGITWKMTEKQSVAFTYRSQVDMNYKGDFSLGGGFAMEVKYPNTVEVGYGIQVTDTLQLEAMLQWSEWSVNDTQVAKVGDLGSIPQENNWDDTITVAVGGSWNFTEDWVFRTGYSFIETPIPDSTITPILPDMDRHVIGVGLGYTIAGHTLDLSYAHLIYEDKSSPPGSVAPGTYDIDSDLVGLTYSYSF